MSIKSYANLTEEFLGHPVLKFQTGFAAAFYESLSKIIIEESHLFASLNEADRTKISYSEGKRFSGWNKVNLLDWKYKECEILKNILLDGFKVYLEEFKSQYRKSRPKYITCWPNIMANYSEPGAHAHDCNPFNVSGTFYVSGDFAGGMIRTIFWPDKNKKSVERIYEPAQGDFILFPSTLVHHILPYRSDILRVSVGFDILFNKNPHVSFCEI